MFYHSNVNLQLKLLTITIKLYKTMHYITLSVKTNNCNNLVTALEEEFLYNYPQLINSIIINGNKDYETPNANILKLSFSQWLITINLVNQNNALQVVTYCQNFCADFNNNITLLDYTIYTDNSNYVELNQQSNTIQLNNIIVFNNQQNYNNYQGTKHKIYINASTAFGTGEHSTTHMCLQLLQNLQQTNPNLNNILDVGTGSGILAIASKKLFNHSTITATDIDPIAIQTALNFFTFNKVNINTAVANGLQNINLPQQNLIMANILMQPLLNLVANFYQLLQPNGYVILSGFLNTQQQQIITAYSSSKYPFKVIQTLQHNNWIALLLQKQ